MRHLHTHRHETIAKAWDAGVPIYAGTDAGGTIKHGLIASEVRLLAAVGSGDGIGSSVLAGSRVVGR